MVQDSRSEISLLEEAKTGFSALIRQTATVFASFLIMLLIAGGAPSSFVLMLSVGLGITFVAWSEQKRVQNLVQVNPSPDSLPSVKPALKDLPDSIYDYDESKSSDEGTVQPITYHFFGKSKGNIEVVIRRIGTGRPDKAPNSAYEKISESSKSTLTQEPKRVYIDIWQSNATQDISQAEIQGLVNAVGNSIMGHVAIDLTKDATQENQAPE